MRLTDERWRHVLGHPEMVGMEKAVSETLEDPDLVVRSITDDETLLNYRYYLRTMAGNKWLCVLVKYADEDAFVLTAYLTDKVKRGETIWRKQ